jgi:hypothetical protein
MRRARHGLGGDFRTIFEGLATPLEQSPWWRVDERRIVVLLTREVGAAEPHTSSAAGGCQELRERWRVMTHQAATAMAAESASSSPAVGDGDRPTGIQVTPRGPSCSPGGRARLRLSCFDHHHPSVAQAGRKEKSK